VFLKFFWEEIARLLPGCGLDHMQFQTTETYFLDYYNIRLRLVLASP